VYHQLLVVCTPKPQKEALWMVEVMWLKNSIYGDTSANE
jgi:hypothetical protein